MRKTNLTTKGRTINKLKTGSVLSYISMGLDYLESINEEGNVDGIFSLLTTDK